MLSTGIHLKKETLQTSTLFLTAFMTIACCWCKQSQGNFLCRKVTGRLRHGLMQQPVNVELDHCNSDFPTSKFRISLIICNQDILNSFSKVIEVKQLFSVCVCVHQRNCDSPAITKPNSTRAEITEMFHENWLTKRACKVLKDSTWTHTSLDTRQPTTRYNLEESRLH